MDAVVAVGQPAPNFALHDLQGTVHQLADLHGRVLILNFWSAECPWSERADQELQELRDRWHKRITIWAIDSNANETPEQIRTVAAARKLPVVLIDQNHQVADLYGAVTTPHLFLVDLSGILRYRGALDDITFRKRKATRHHLRAAVEALLSGRQVEVTETPPYGCAIVRHKPL